MLPSNSSLDRKASSLPIFKGYIEVGQECPFIRECEVKRAGNCYHYGETHPTPYVCKTANEIYRKLK